jgi:hypothetical protein
LGINFGSVVFLQLRECPNIQLLEILINWYLVSSKHKPQYPYLGVTTMSNQDTNRLQDQVNHIADTLTNGFEGFMEENEFGEVQTAMDYLQDVLDIQYIVTGSGEYLGARILVAFGGPNIWVDTQRGIVEGFWWGDYAKASFNDGIDLDEALSELWACR